MVGLYSTTLHGTLLSGSIAWCTALQYSTKLYNTVVQVYHTDHWDNFLIFGSVATEWLGLVLTVQLLPGGHPLLLPLGHPLSLAGRLGPGHHVAGRDELDLDEEKRSNLQGNRKRLSKVQWYCVLSPEHVLHLCHISHDVLDQDQRHRVVHPTLALTPQHLLVPSVALVQDDLQQGG
jgi:hypothetical protein